jgi:hypothetical protein
MDGDFDPIEVKYSEVRSKLEVADDALSQGKLRAELLSEHTDPIAVAQATRAAELAEAIAEKATKVADLLRESVTTPVVG